MRKLPPEATTGAIVSATSISRLFATLWTTGSYTTNPHLAQVRAFWGRRDILRPRASRPYILWRVAPASLEQYLELEETVPFSVPGFQLNKKFYFEKSMVQSDGRMNSHTIQQQVRALTNEEYRKIERAGFRTNWNEEEERLVVTPSYGFAEDPPESVERDRILTSRTFRDRVFRQLVGKAYNMRCAMTGISMQAPDGSCEIGCAHIRPVKHLGPDSINNGIALLQSIHWMFDNGLISIGPDYEILKSSRCNKPKIAGLINESGKITLPKNNSHFPPSGISALPSRAHIPPINPHCS